MALPLTDKGNELTDMIPRHLRDAKSFQQVFDVKAREFTRIDDAVEDMRLNSFYQTATWALDDFEYDLGLPVAPTGASYADRRTLIALKVVSLFAGEGQSFSSIVSSIAPGSTVDTIYDTSTVNVRMPIVTSPSIQTQLEATLRQIIPAHLLFHAEYANFIAGLSKAGDSL